MVASSEPVCWVDPKPLIKAGLVLGIGLGGFVDGILFHQLLQFHQMLSAVLPKTSIVNVEINMFWDGLFHVFTWFMTVWGLAMLWKVGEREDVPWSRRIFVGSLLCGWGVFNLVEGVIDHHILGLHHVYEPAGFSIWDYVFLASGAAMLGVGRAMIHREWRAGTRLRLARHVTHPV